MRKKIVLTSSFAAATVALLFAAAATFAAASDALVLADAGRSEYSIVLPDAPTPVQTTAASELRSYLRQAADVELPIVSEKDVRNVETAKIVAIGPSALSQRLLGDSVDESKIGYDGVILKRVGDAIVLSGHSRRGPIYAVYEFLERELGFRQWTATEASTPKKSRVVVDELDYVYAPKLEYRESFYLGAFDGPFAVKMKCNGSSEPIAPEFGGNHQFEIFVHSSYVLLPPEKYFLEHPNWYPEIDGVRKVGRPGWAGVSQEYRDFESRLKPEQIFEAGTQLCWSNDEALAEMAKNAKDRLRDDPAATFISISQNDWRGNCQCDTCRALDEAAGSPAGSLLYGVNKVAEEIEKEFPNVYVETLAYQYTRKPPKNVKPRKNVVVRLCSIECSFSQPLDSEQNKAFRDDVDGWSQIADKLFVWDYATDFALYLLPFPNYRVLAPNIRFYVDRNVVGLFEQGDYQTATGDFVQLRNWVVSKLLWNPELDPTALRDEFVAGYYAPELVPIYAKYFDVLSDAVEKSNVFLTIYRRSTSDWLDLDSLNKATRLQNEALEVAKKLEQENPEQRAGLVAKVRRERIPLDLVWNQEYRRALLASKIRGTEFLGPNDPLAAARDLCDRFDEFGVALSREGESAEAFAEFKKELTDRFEGFEAGRANVPDFCANAPENSWIDVQEFEMNKTRLGDWTFVENDAAASNGKAVKMPGTHFEWATSWNVPSIVSELKSSSGNDASEPATFRVYAFVRCDASVDAGSAATAGVYDSDQKKNVAYRDLAVSEFKGAEYRVVDFGSVALNANQYVWFAPPKRPGEVDAVYVDRIVVVRE